MTSLKNLKGIIMFDCFTSSRSVYFEEAFDTEFRKQYKGVIVNARGYGGHGHFAIRKPSTFRSRLPKFIRKILGKICPYKWIMWKNDREELHRLFFNDADRSISIDAEMKNPSYRTLVFDKATYEDLKNCIPPFLHRVGYRFETEETDGVMTLIFEPVTE